MNRRDLQRLSNIRLAEAKVLLDNEHYSGAYFKAWSVERIARRFIWPSHSAQEVRVAPPPGEYTRNDCPADNHKPQAPPAASASPAAAHERDAGGQDRQCPR